MPKPPLPPALEEFLAQPNPATIATLQPDGRPHTAATWYLWKDGNVLVNMDPSRKRLRHLRTDPRVSITVLGGDDWYRHVTLRGRVVAIDDDTGFDGIDRLSRHYTGHPYAQRDRGRVNAWIEVEAWYAWQHGRPWNGSG
ncbi:MAG: PPOX class F420-dependent oxidoreductase [Solirubrobacteraceae bacterium]